MKFKLLATVLGLSEISLKSGIFGGKPFVSFSEEQLELIEQALEKEDVSGLQKKIADLEAEAKALNSEKKALSTAISSALELNSMDAEETLTESVKKLGTTCKEYGSKQVTHTDLGNNGEEFNVDEDGLINGYIDPNAEHNKMLGIKK